MSGRKNHFIQKLHLAGFAFPDDGPVRTWVFRRGNGIFPVAIADHGAERDFYGEELDDRITDLEIARCNSILHGLRAMPDGFVPTKDAAFITIFSFARSKNIRQMFLAGAKPLVSGLMERLREPDCQRRMLQKAILADPEKFVPNTADRNVRRMLSDPKRLSRWVRDYVKENPAAVKNLIEETKSRIGEMVEMEHRQSIARQLDVYDGSRVRNFESLKWRCVTTERDLILGDSVLVSELGDGKFRSVHEPGDELAKVWFPVARRRVLVGAQTDEVLTIDVDRLNQASAACSFDSYCAHSRSEEIDGLMPLIRSRVISLSDEELECAISKLVEKFL